MNRVRFKRNCLSLILLLLLVKLALSGPEAGRENLFLLGVDARALGMGGAYVSVTDGASSIFWNPAGLALLDKGEASFMHVSLWEKTIYDFASLAYPTLDFGSYGIGAIRLGTTDVPKRDINNLDLGTFDNTISVYTFSVASSFPLYTKGGVSFKLYNQSIDGNSANGVGIDLGILATPNPHFSWGINLQDLLEPTLQLTGQKEKIPLNLKAGISFNQDLGPISLLLATDIDQTRSRKAEFHVGGEIGIERALFLRGGYDRGYATVGAGVKWNWLRADYALKTHSDLGETHRFSLTVQFGKSAEQRRLAREERSQSQLELSRQKERQQRINSYLSEAKQKEAESNWLAALESYNKVLALSPDHELATKKTEELRGRLELRTPAVSTDTGKLELVKSTLAKAQELYRKGSYKLAEDRVKEVLEMEPANSEGLQLQSSINLALQEKVAQLEQEAKSLHRSGNLQQAILVWSQILELDSTNQSAQQGLKQADREVRLNTHIKAGIEYFNAGNSSAAQQEFYSALSLSPQDPVAADYLVKVRAKLEKTTTLEDLKNDPQIWQLYQSGLEKYQKGDYQGAIDAWQEVLKVYPNNRNTLRNIEQAKLRLK